MLTLVNVLLIDKLIDLTTAALFLITAIVAKIAQKPRAWAIFHASTVCLHTFQDVLFTCLTSNNRPQPLNFCHMSSKGFCIYTSRYWKIKSFFK